MKITKTTEYALRTMIYLAKQNSRCTASVICDANDIPIKSFQKITQNLVTKDLIVVTRGKLGGFSLPRCPKEISALEIIQSSQEVDYDSEECRSFDETCIKPEQPCTCLLHDCLVKLNELEREVLSKTTLYDLALGIRHCCDLEQVREYHENMMKEKEQQA